MKNKSMNKTNFKTPLRIFGISVGILFASCTTPSDHIEQILQQMTLEEKVGQMAQVTIDLLIDAETTKLKEDAVKKGIVDYKIGSVLNTFNNSAPEKEVWASMIKELQDCTQQTRLQIPLIYGVDAIHGVTYTNKAVLFPQQIAMAATFNRELVRRGAEICAYETRASSIPWNFSPVLDLGIDFRWARLWETFGEDPYLCSEMGVQMTLGYQGEDFENIDKYHVSACPKHFLAYSVPVSGKDRTPAILSENVLREYHLPSFQAAIEAGATSIMVNSGLINGEPVHASHFLLTELLKKELNFDGVIVTDWMDIENLYSRDRVAVSRKDAVRLAINAGVDMSMIPYNYDFCDFLIELVNEGAVPMSRIDDAVRRILRLKERLNLFEVPYTSPEDYPLFGSAEFEKSAYDAASEAVTLLKNENDILPLAKNKKVLVCGPNANTMRALNGGWSYSWQGEKAPQYTERYNTILEAIQNKIGANRVEYVAGVSYIEDEKYWAEKENGIKQAVAKARSCDYVVLCLGENSYCEKPGDLHDLSLSDLQIQLANELAATGKPIVLVLNEGRPRIIEKFVDKMNGIIMVYLPGNFGGDALADVLFGDVNPSGKLPYTYPRYPHSMVNYWHKYSEEQVRAEGMYDYESDYSPLYEFGHGLSYTTFEYSDITLSKTEMTENETITVSVDVKNTGNRVGKEAVLMYVSDLYASLAPDMKRLRAFEKIALEPGESKTVEFTISKKELSFVNLKNETIAEPGDFEVKIGGKKAGFVLK